MNDVEQVMPSDRKFGYFFSVVFLLVTIYSIYRGNNGVAVLFSLLTLSTFLATLIKPTVLHPFNRIWLKFGLLLGKVISPIVLGILFFLLIVPVGVVTRLFGRDELDLKKSNQVTCWKVRDETDQSLTSFKNQF